jgi:hypothetical protein
MNSSTTITTALVFGVFVLNTASFAQVNNGGMARRGNPIINRAGQGAPVTGAGGYGGTVYGGGYNGQGGQAINGGSGLRQSGGGMQGGQRGPVGYTISQEEIGAEGLPSGLQNQVRGGKLWITPDQKAVSDNDMAQGLNQLQGTASYLQQGNIAAAMQGLNAAYNLMTQAYPIYHGYRYKARMNAMHAYTALQRRGMNGTQRAEILVNTAISQAQTAIQRW